MSHRWGPRWILAVGALVTAAGYLGRMLVSTDVTAAIVWATVVGFGVGIGYAALPMLIVAHAEARHIGAANGVNALVRAIGTALASAGVSALAALLAVEASGRTVPGPAAFTVVGTLAVAFALGVFAAAAGIRQRTHP